MLSPESFVIHFHGLIMGIRDGSLITKKRANTKQRYSRRESIVLKFKYGNGKQKS